MLHNVLVHIYLKTATTKIKTIINIALKIDWSKWLSNASIWNARKGINKCKKSSMKYSLGYSDYSPGQQPSLQSVPPISLAVLRPPHVWVRQSLLAFLFRPSLMSLSQVLEFKMISFIFFKKTNISPNEHFHSDI